MNESNKDQNLVKEKDQNNKSFLFSLRPRPPAHTFRYPYTAPHTLYEWGIECIEWGRYSISPCEILRPKRANTSTVLWGHLLAILFSCHLSH